MIRLVSEHEGWVLGFVDETWWSRLAQPDMHTWADGEPLHLLEKMAYKDDPDPKALCCYGILRTDIDQIMLRFVDGRPVSHVTIDFLKWVLKRLAAEGKKVLVLVWDNASWHISKMVRNWIRAYNKEAKREGGVRIITCRLPIKSPWLNSIEPHWVHGKRAIVEPARTLTAAELIKRICDYFGCKHLRHLAKKVA